MRNKLHLPINRDKSGIRRPANFQILGFGFVSTYRKGEKGKYQLVVSKKGWDGLYAWSRTRMGGWAVAQSPILGTTITLSRLRRKGYESMLDYYLKTLPQIQ